MKKVATEQNESGSSDEENDDEDGFEILTAEKLFSTLLQRVSSVARTRNLIVEIDLLINFFLSHLTFSCRSVH